MDRKGITIAGNILTDVVKNINIYPKVGMLANISSVSRAVGGCAPNTSINLAKIDRSIPISVIGCVGQDEYAEYIISCIKAQDIDVKGIVSTPDAPTSFSDVMSLPSGERTFFYASGANTKFSPEQVDINKLDCELLHIGYISLLDRFDEKDEEYGTVMVRFLHDVREKGILTSIDTVSDTSPEFAAKVIPALKYCDYVIINEIEVCSIWQTEPRNEDGSLNLDNLREAMQKTLDAGVHKKVVVHSKEAGFCLNKNGSFTVVPSLKIPPELIKGSVGAGDAFCAGTLYSIYHGLSDKESLEFASAAAACNLFSENSVDGMKDKEEIKKLMQSFTRRVL